MTESKRRTAWFNAAGRQVELYEMTDGQRIAMAAVNARDNRAVVQRLWQVLESLFVDPADFERLDTAVVTGKVDWPAMEKFSQDVAGYEWPPKVELQQMPRGQYTRAEDEAVLRPGQTSYPYERSGSLTDGRAAEQSARNGADGIPDTFRPLTVPNDEPY